MKARTLLTLGGVALVGAIVAGVAWHRAHLPAAGAAFTPNFQNDKELVLSGWTSEETRQVLSDFERLYFEQLPSNFDFVVEPGDGVHHVRFPHDIAPWMFIYLVNYATYPKAPDTKGRDVHVAGTVTLSPDFTLPAQDLYGRKAVFYVPANDKDFDKVFARIGKQAWQISLKGEGWLQATDGRWPAALDALVKP